MGEGKAALEARQRAADAATGRKPGQKRNPRGGLAYKRPFGVPKDKAQCNFTDPESRIMKTSQHGFQQAYNAQTGVESEHQQNVETCVTNQAADQNKLLPMVPAVKETYGQQPDKVLVDAGYCSEANLAGLASRGVDGYESLGREGRKAMSFNPETRPLTAQMQAKLATPNGGRFTRSASGSRRPPTGGSRTFSAFADSVSVARRRSAANGTWSAFASI